MRLSAIRSAERLGISDPGTVKLDMGRLATHLDRITGTLGRGFVTMLESQGVEIIRGRGHLTGANTAEAVTGNGTVLSGAVTSRTASQRR